MAETGTVEPGTNGRETRAICHVQRLFERTPMILIGVQAIGWVGWLVGWVRARASCRLATSSGHLQLTDVVGVSVPPSWESRI